MSLNSRLIEAGLSSADRALLLGHAVETNERAYSHSDKRRLEKISACLLLQQEKPGSFNASGKCSQRESNPHLALRRRLFYPLNYEN